MPPKVSLIFINKQNTMSYLNISSNLFLCFFNFIHIPNGYGGNIEHVMQLKWKFEYRKYIIMFKQKIEFLFSHSRLPSSLRQNNHMPTGQTQARCMATSIVHQRTPTNNKTIRVLMHININSVIRNVITRTFPPQPQIATQHHENL